MDDKDIKLCPYRIYTQSGDYITKNGTWKRDSFRECLKNECMGYNSATEECDYNVERRSHE